MDKQVQKEYARLRALRWPARQALATARWEARFQAYVDAGLARFRVEPDDEPANALDGDFSPAVLRALQERAERDGVWGIVVEARNPYGGKWRQLDAVWGFIGDDWQDSGYDSDCKVTAVIYLDDFSIDND